MKILELKISNVLSFKYCENIDDAINIIFDKNLNIFIGENGAGKSTALEVINFIFKRVLFTQFNLNQDLYSRKSTLNSDDKRQILSPANNLSYSGFRLDPNWNTEDKEQKIKLIIELDEIDTANINHLVKNKDKLSTFITSYTNHQVTPSATTLNTYIIEIIFKKTDKKFSVNISPNNSDPGYLYLVNYNFYKELINLYNFENPQEQVSPLYESFTLIGGYRNYHSFNPGVSLQGSSASQQIQQIRTQEFSKSLNANEQSEPSIFNLVRLRVAGKHYEIYGEESKGVDCEKEANNQKFLIKINEKLKLVNLKVGIKFTEKQKWNYSFQFQDLKRKKPLNDINSLSAGQKAIIHLVFEAYGRGDLKGGLVIIDEPEIHLHYQFQNEYLRVIDEINKEQSCQYILVTHSESLINSITIHKVKRFALNENNQTVIKSPSLSTDQKTLIKILDNTRSTYAFFAKKVLLVEGEIDRYFFKALLQEIKPELNQEIAILDIMGKSNYNEWKNFFESFGLTTYFIGDLDSAFSFLYPTETMYKLNSPEIIKGFKCTHPNIVIEIEKKYSENIFILKDGDLEHYLDIHNKGLSEIIKFCDEKLINYTNDEQNKKSKEINFILNEIIKK